MLLENDGDSSDDDSSDDDDTGNVGAPVAKQSDYKARLKSLYTQANKVQLSDSASAYFSSANTTANATIATNSYPTNF